MVEVDKRFWIKNGTHCCGPFPSSEIAKEHREFCWKLKEKVLNWTRSGPCQICQSSDLPQTSMRATFPFGTQDGQRVQDVMVVVPLEYAADPNKTS